jgi:hypothetical protein
MMNAARKLLDDFATLGEAERREVAVEILRRTELVGYGAPGDSELLSAADQIFLDLDRREAESGISE